MKQHINKIVLLGILIIFIMQFGNRATEASVASDLMALVSVLEGENISVDEWSVHAREELSDAEGYAKELQEQFSEWKWTFSKQGQHWEVVGTSQEYSSIEETVRIISTPTEQQSRAYVIYEVKGDAWGVVSENFLKKELSSTYSAIFRGNPTLFSCVKSDFNGKMKATLSTGINNLLTAFEAEQIESLAEDTFISVTASSPIFTESLKNNDENINLQLALRSQGMGAKTTLVVGTPIITIEY